MAIPSQHAPKRHSVIGKRVYDVSRTALKRLARRGGVKRIAGVVYPEVQSLLVEFLRGVIKDAFIFMEYSRRKTVTAMDVVYALKRNGHMTLYGFNPSDTAQRTRPVHRLANAWKTTTAEPPVVLLPDGEPDAVDNVETLGDVSSVWNDTTSEGPLALPVTSTCGGESELLTVRDAIDYRDLMPSVQPCSVSDASEEVWVGPVLPLFAASALLYPMWSAWVRDATDVESVRCALHALYVSNHVPVVVVDDDSVRRSVLLQAIALLSTPANAMDGGHRDLTIIVVRKGPSEMSMVRSCPLQPNHVNVQVCTHPMDALAVATTIALETTDEAAVGLVATGSTIDTCPAWVRRSSMVFWPGSVE